MIFDVVANEKEKDIFNQIDKIESLFRSKADIKTRSYLLDKEDLEIVFGELIDVRAKFVRYVCENAEEKDKKTPLLRIDSFKDHVKVYEDGKDVRCLAIEYSASINGIPQVTITKTIGNDDCYCVWHQEG